MAAAGNEDELLVVIAHSLLASLRDIERGADTLMSRGSDLPVDVRTRSLYLIQTRADLVSNVLIDILQGSRPQLVAALDQLRTT